MNDEGKKVISRQSGRRAADPLYLPLDEEHCPIAALFVCFLRL
jgi:hypothetical protein